MKKSVRVLNISPKAQLSLTDSTSDVYPTILRTGDERNLGNDKSIFDDFKTQRFVKQDVIMPYNASKDWVDQSGFLTGTITLNKEITPQSQFLTTYKDYSYDPYDEARNPSSFYGSGSIRNQGFDETLYQGFSSEISSKIAIPIDISITQDIEIKIQDVFGDSVTTSPFVYYNFQNKQWDQIGTTDPATGNSTDYYHLMDAVYRTVGGDTWLDCKENSQPLLKQFTTSPGIATEVVGSGLGEINLRKFGYDKIGYPTSFFDAPNSKRYHATNAQTLKLSDYITSPFILEKIQVIFPAKGTRYHNGDPKSPSFISGSGRDIDNHVFFIYRQNRSKSPIDSASDVSSSIRALIGNESFCFYNRFSMPTKLAVGTYERPIHEYGFLQDYSMPLTTLGTFVTAPKIVDMQFTPKTYEQQYTAPSTIGLLTPNTITNGYIQNYWDGGQRSDENNTDLIRAFETLPQAIRSIQVRGNNQFTFTTASNPNMPEKTHTFDPRTQRSSTFFTSFREPVARPLAPNSYFDYDVTSTDLGYRKNLYLLLPEDELVFGIDAGLFPTYHQDLTVTKLGATAPYDLPKGYLDDVNVLTDVGDTTKDTTSRLTMLAGEAKVILYGSLIKEGVEHLGSLNQKLTSPAIHEDIHQVISDQFQVNEAVLYSGSYIANVIQGTMTSGAGSRTLTAVLDKTLGRFVTLTNFSTQFSNGSIETSITTSRQTPKLPTFRFRYDKFGQFRDMLEQRLDSKGYEFKYTSNALPIPNFIRTFGNSPIPSPIVVSFVSQSSTINVTPSDTRSGNLSFECTSSLPYYDDDIPRNRSNIVFGANPQFSVQTVILDKASTLLSTT